jgi:hypothetical protein
MIAGMEEFVVRPAYVSGKPLIEFRGDHRSDSFPNVLALLERSLPEFQAQGSSPAPDDFVWVCSFSAGRFELLDDWGGLFVVPLTEVERVVYAVAAVLERSGAFRRSVADPVRPSNSANNCK